MAPPKRRLIPPTFTWRTELEDQHRNLHGRENLKFYIAANINSEIKFTSQSGGRTRPSYDHTSKSSFHTLYADAAPLNNLATPFLSQPLKTM